MAEQRISGTLAAAVTPLRDAGKRLDKDAFAPLLEFYGASGLDGLLVLGTTGEGILLEPGERRRAAELAIAGAGTTRDRALRRADHGANQRPSGSRRRSRRASGRRDRTAVLRL